MMEKHLLFIQNIKIACNGLTNKISNTGKNEQKQLTANMNCAKNQVKSDLFYDFAKQ